MAEAEYESDQSVPRSVEFSAWGMGLIFTAMLLMLLVGSFHMLQGVAALIDDTFYTVKPGYDIGLDVTTWGWAQIVGGTLIMTSGLFLLTGMLWARLVAIATVFLSALGSFYSIPYYPVWSILMLILEVALLWALLVHGHDLATEFGEE